MRGAHRRRGRLVLLPVVGALAMLASACGGDDPASDDPASDDPASDDPASDGTASDGTASDDHASDGTASDGTASDGTASDDHASDDHASDGTASDDTASDGTPLVSVPTGEPTASSTTPDPSGSTDEQRFPEIVGVEVTAGGDGTYDFAVTISSPYDTPERYADGWRIVGPGATVYGEHTLAHDHAAEQPFTRTQRGVAIPDGVTEVIVEARDLVNGFGGETETVQLPDR